MQQPVHPAFGTDTVREPGPPNHLSGGDPHPAGGGGIEPVQVVPGPSVGGSDVLMDERPRGLGLDEPALAVPPVLHQNDRARRQPTDPSLHLGSLILGGPAMAIFGEEILGGSPVDDHQVEVRAIGGEVPHIRCHIDALDPSAEVRSELLEAERHVFDRKVGDPQPGIVGRLDDAGGDRTDACADLQDHARPPPANQVIDGAECEPAGDVAASRPAAESTMQRIAADV